MFNIGKAKAFPNQFHKKRELLLSFVGNITCDHCRLLMQVEDENRVRVNCCKAGLTPPPLQGKEQETLLPDSIACDALLDTSCCPVFLLMAEEEDAAEEVPVDGGEPSPRLLVGGELPGLAAVGLMSELGRSVRNGLWWRAVRRRILKTWGEKFVKALESKGVYTIIH